MKKVAIISDGFEDCTEIIKNYLDGKVALIEDNKPKSIEIPNGLFIEWKKQSKLSKRKGKRKNLWMIKKDWKG